MNPRDATTPANRAPTHRCGQPATNWVLRGRKCWPGDHGRAGCCLLDSSWCSWATRADWASRPSLRKAGIELTANRRPAAPLDGADADLSLAQARFRDDNPAGNRIPVPWAILATVA